MKTNYCRKISTINYEYFLFSGTDKSLSEAFDWVKSFEEDAAWNTIEDEEDAIKIASRKGGCCFILREGEPVVLLRPAGCDEINIVSVKDFDENYKIIRK